MISVNLFLLSIVFSIVLSDIHFLPGNREVELFILLLLAFKFSCNNLYLVKPKYTRDFLFLIYTAYMLINVSSGVIYNGLSLHWLLFFLMAYPLMSEAKKISEWTILRKKKAISSLVNALLVFNLFGFLFYIVDLSAIGIKPTKLLLPIIAFLPFAIFNIKYGSNKDRFFAYLTILLSFSLIMVESSRGTLMVSFAILSIGLWIIGVKTLIRRDMIKLAPILAISLVLLMANIDMGTIIDDTLLIFSDFVEPDQEKLKDLDRYLNFSAVFDFYQDSSATTILFGTGFRSSWLYVSPYLEFLYAESMPSLDYSKDQAIIGFPGLLVDIGVIGLLLFFMMFMATILSTIKDLPFRWQLLIAVTVFGVFARNYGNNVSTSAITMLVIMPYGVFWFLSNTLQSIRSEAVT
jgi:hypothetical protein